MMNSVPWEQNSSFFLVSFQNLFFHEAYMSGRCGSHEIIKVGWIWISPEFSHWQRKNHPWETLPIKHDDYNVYSWSKFIDLLKNIFCGLDNNVFSWLIECIRSEFFQQNRKNVGHSSLLNTARESIIRFPWQLNNRRNNSVIYWLYRTNIFMWKKKFNLIEYIQKWNYHPWIYYICSCVCIERCLYKYHVPYWISKWNKYINRVK